eukprot:2455384-Prymnesium_polylepis.1
MLPPRRGALLTVACCALSTPADRQWPQCAPPPPAMPSRSSVPPWPVPTSAAARERSRPRAPSVPRPPPPPRPCASPRASGQPAAARRSPSRRARAVRRTADLPP